MARSRGALVGTLVPIGLAAVAIGGMWLSMSGKKQVLHPDPNGIPAATHRDPAAKWSETVGRARRIVRARLSNQNLPGLSVAVGAGGDIIWAEGFGWANMEPLVPVTPKTRFRIGTASTVLTSAAAGLLLERGRLRLDDEIQTYVPQFPKKQWDVTLRQLMAEVGGVGPDDEDDGPLFRQRCERPLEALPHFANGPLIFQPDTQYRPSKYGWILVSAAVEAAAGKPFLTAMREQIFQPLRMDDTGAESASEENPERVGEPEEDPPFMTFIRQVILKPLGIVETSARPATEPVTVYLSGFGPNPIPRYGMHVMRLHNLSCYAGSLAFFSTPSDLVRFGLALHGGSLLKPDTVRLLQTSQRLVSGQETGHGLGWDLRTVPQAAGRDGELLGRRVMSLLMFRETGIVVAVMSNMASADTSDLALKVAEAFH